jgi:hypothetical protein
MFEMVEDMRAERSERYYLAEIRELRDKSDAEMLRVKMCEHIAEGEEGWNTSKNRDICPSTAAVGFLRENYEKAIAALEICQQAFNEIEHARQSPNWFTKGEHGAWMQSSMWLRRGFDAVKSAIPEPKDEMTK